MAMDAQYARRRTRSTAEATQPRHTAASASQCGAAAAAAAARPSDEPPRLLSLCWKEKPRLHTWPERYAILEGHRLLFCKAKSEAEAIGKASATKPEKSAVRDVRGCTVEGGWEDWGLQQLPRVVLSRADLRSCKFCFASESQRDVFLTALTNAAAGREWRPPEVSAEQPAGGSAATRCFRLLVVDSAALCPQDTRLAAITAADLHQLCAAVGTALSGTNDAATVSPLRLEVLDADFGEWIGPLILDDVPSTATVRVMIDADGTEAANIDRHNQRQLSLHRRSFDGEAVQGGGHGQPRRQGAERDRSSNQSRVQPVVGLRMM
jgi:hypothetical protein|eukprot:COSAG06_NODE_2145_length_7480_cov_48.475274_7_plen_322_part_00